MGAGWRDDARQSKSVPTEFPDEKDHRRQLARGINELKALAALYPIDTPPTISATYTMVDSDAMLLCKCDNPITVYLLTAAGREGRQLAVKKIDAGATVVVIDGFSTETIDGATAVTLTAQYSVMTIKSDGTNWEIIGAINAATASSYTDEQAQDAIGTILTDTATIDLTYNDGAPSITADIKTASVTEAMQVLADNTTQDVSTSKHGYAPKGDGNTSKFLNANGAYSTPSAGAGGALTLIASASPSGTIVATFTSIPPSYTHLLMRAHGRSDAAITLGNMLVTFNNDTGSNYDFSYVLVFNTVSANSAVAQTSFQGGVVVGTSGTAGRDGWGEVLIFDYAATTFQKVCRVGRGGMSSTTIASIAADTGYAGWRSSAAITRIDITLSSGNWVAGSRVDIYGVS